MLISLKLQVSRQMFLKRIVLKICLYKFLCTKFDLPLQPYPITEIMILTNLNLYYLRMLSHKFRLIWPICFWKNVSYCFYEKKCHPIVIVTQLYPLKSWFKQTWINSLCLHTSFSISGRLFSEKMYQNVSLLLLKRRLDLTF